MASKNSREKLYKFRGRSGGVEGRIQSKRFQSKQKREELTMRNRGVLNDIQINDTTVKQSPKPTAAIKLKQMHRKEELKVWKKKREIKLKEVKAKQKPVFKVYGSHGSFDSKPVPSVSSKKENIDSSSSTHSKSTKSNGEPSTKRKTSKKVSSKKSHECHVTTTAVTPTKDNSKNAQDNLETTAMEAGESHETSLSAWIPGSKLIQNSQKADFKEIFSKTFSPFKFTGKGAVDSTTIKQKISFTFRKKVTEDMIAPPSVSINDSLDENENEEKFTEAVSNDQEEDHALYINQPLSDNSIEEINNIVAHNNDYTNQQILKCQEENDMDEVNMAALSLQLTSPLTNATCATTHKSSNSSSSSFTVAKECTNDKKNTFKPYRQLHTEVTDRFSHLCHEWESKLEQFREQECGPTEEMADDIHATVCKARLLMRQKLKQYLDLVNLAEDPNTKQKTTPEDLQGFWDMVYFQVEEIDKKFLHFAELEKNQWTETTECVKAAKLRRSKRRASHVASSKLCKTSISSQEPSEKLQAARAKREAARLKLREMKLAAFAKNKAGNDDIQLTPKKNGAPNAQSLASEDVPDLITFSPFVNTKQKPVTPYTLNLLEQQDGAFVTKLVQIKTPKKLLDGIPNIVMSPARRSKRLAVHETTPDLARSVKYKIQPNKALIDI